MKTGVSTFKKQKTDLSKGLSTVIVLLNKVIYSRPNHMNTNKQNTNKQNTVLGIIDLVSTTIILVLVWNFFYKHIVLYSHPDIGWIRSLIWRNPLQKLENESYKSDWQSGWEFHNSALLSIFSLLSYMWPFGAIKYLTVFFSLQILLIFVPILKILQYFLTNTQSIQERIVVNSASILFSLGGSITGAILFPHFELYQITFFVWFLYGVLILNKSIVFVSAILFLSVREDSFLYAAGILLMLSIISKIKSIFNLAVVSLLIFLAQMISRQLLFDTPSIFSTDYLGDPVLSHISMQHFFTRAELIIRSNYPIFIIFYLIFFIGIWQRNRAVIYYSLLLIPTLLMGLFAFSPAKGSFILYYSIPFFFIYFLNIIFILKENSIRFQRVFSIFIGVAFFLSIFQNNFQILQTSTKSIPSGYSEQVLNKVIIDAISNNFLIESSMYVYGSEILASGAVHDIGVKASRCVIVPIVKVQFYLERDTELVQNKFKDYEEFVKLCPITSS